MTTIFGGLNVLSLSGKFEVGDQVLAGTYYQKWGRGEFSYVHLCSSQVTFIHVDLVLVYKFRMLPTHHRVKGGNVVYQLLKETLEVIKTSLEHVAGQKHIVMDA